MTIIIILVLSDDHHPLISNLGVIAINTLCGQRPIKWANTIGLDHIAQEQSGKSLHRLQFRLHLLGA